jgi:hypothetical protein
LSASAAAAAEEEEESAMRRRFQDSVKALEADIEHANEL